MHPRAKPHRAQQRSEPGSICRLYRQLIEVRRSHTALQRGSYRPIVAGGDLLLYLRELESSRILVALNLGGDPAAFTFPPDAMSGRLLLSTHCDREGEAVSSTLALRPHEGVIAELSE